jgi:hypothetical protein
MVSGCNFHSLAQLHQYSTVVLQQSDSLPTLESLGLLRWQGPCPPPQLPQMGLFTIPWAGNSVEKETSQFTSLDAPWDAMRASLDEVSINAGGASPTQVDVEVKKKNGRKVGRGKTEMLGRSHVLLNSKLSSDDVEAVLILISARASLRRRRPRHPASEVGSFRSPGGCRSTRRSSRSRALRPG